MAHKVLLLNLPQPMDAGGPSNWAASQHLVARNLYHSYQEDSSAAAAAAAHVRADKAAAALQHGFVLDPSQQLHPDEAVAPLEAWHTQHTSWREATGMVDGAFDQSQPAEPSGEAWEMPVELPAIATTGVARSNDILDQHATGTESLLSMKSTAEALSSRTFMADRSRRIGLETGDVVVLMVESRLYTVVDAPLAAGQAGADPDPPRQHVLELGTDHWLPPTYDEGGEQGRGTPRAAAAQESGCSMACCLEVVRQGQYIGLRSAAAGWRFMQPRKRPPHGLVFFNTKCGVWEQWEVEGAEAVAHPWSLLPITLRSRRLPQVVLSVEVARAGSYTSPSRLPFLSPSRGSPGSQDIGLHVLLRDPHVLDGPGGAAPGLLMSQEHILALPPRGPSQQPRDAWAGDLLHPPAAPHQLGGPGSLAPGPSQPAGSRWSGGGGMRGAGQQVEVGGGGAAGSTITGGGPGGGSGAGSSAMGGLGEDENLRRISGLLVQEWLRFVDSEKAARQEVEDELSGLQGELLMLKSDVVDQVGEVRMLVQEELVGLFNVVRLREAQLVSAEVTRRRALTTAVTALWRRRGQHLQSGVLDTWHTWARRRVTARHVVYRHRQHVCARLLSAILQWWAGRARQRRGWGVLMVRGVMTSSRRRLQHALACWQWVTSRRLQARRALLALATRCEALLLSRAVSAWHHHTLDMSSRRHRAGLMHQAHQQALLRDAVTGWWQCVEEGHTLGARLTRGAAWHTKVVLRRTLAAWWGWVCRRRWEQSVIGRCRVRRDKQLLQAAFTGLQRCVVMSRVLQLVPARCSHRLLARAWCGWWQYLRNLADAQHKLAHCQHSVLRTRLHLSLRVWLCLAQQRTASRWAGIHKLSRHTAAALTAGLAAWWSHHCGPDEHGAATSQLSRTAAVAFSPCHEDQHAVGASGPGGSLVAPHNHPQEGWLLHVALSSWLLALQHSRYQVAAADEQVVRGQARLVARVMAGWRDVCVQLAALRQQAVSCGVASRTRCVLLAWRDVCSLEQTSGRWQQHVSRVLGASQLQRVFTAWLDLTLSLQSSRDTAELQGCKLDQWLVRSCWVGWQEVTLHLRGARHTAAQRGQQHDRQLVGEVWSAWKGVCDHLREARCACEAAGQVHVTQQLQNVWDAWYVAAQQSAAVSRAAQRAALRRRRRRALHTWFAQWYSAVEHQQWRAACVATMTGSRHRQLAGSVLRTWSMLSTVMATQRLQLERHQARRRLRTLHHHFTHWQLMTAESRQRTEAIKACIKRKKVAFQQFKSWYWESFDADVQETIRRMFYTTEQALAAPGQQRAASQPGASQAHLLSRHTTTPAAAAGLQPGGGHVSGDVPVTRLPAAAAALLARHTTTTTTTSTGVRPVRPDLQPAGGAAGRTSHPGTFTTRTTAPLTTTTTTRLHPATMVTSATPGLPHGLPRTTGPGGRTGGQAAQYRPSVDHMGARSSRPTTTTTITGPGIRTGHPAGAPASLARRLSVSAGGDPASAVALLSHTLGSTTHAAAPQRSTAYGADLSSWSHMTTNSLYMQDSYDNSLFDEQLLGLQGWGVPGVYGAGAAGGHTGGRQVLGSSLPRPGSGVFPAPQGSSTPGVVPSALTASASLYSTVNNPGWTLYSDEEEEEAEGEEVGGLQSGVEGGPGATLASCSPALSHRSSVVMRTLAEAAAELNQSPGARYAHHHP